MIGGDEDSDDQNWDRITTIATEMTFHTAASAGTVHIDQVISQQLPTVTEVPDDVRAAARVLMAGTLTPEGLFQSIFGRYLTPQLENIFSHVEPDAGTRVDLRAGRITLGRPRMPLIMSVNPAMQQARVYLHPTLFRVERTRCSTIPRLKPC